MRFLSPSSWIYHLTDSKSGKNQTLKHNIINCFYGVILGYQDLVAMISAWSKFYTNSIFGSGNVKCFYISLLTISLKIYRLNCHHDIIFGVFLCYQVSFVILNLWSKCHVNSILVAEVFDQKDGNGKKSCMDF